MSQPPQGIARFDSAAGMVQALALALRGRPYTSPSESPLLDSLMPAINRLPCKLREQVYAFGGMTEGIGPSQVARVDVEAIAEWMAGLYPQRRYPAAFIGSSNGALMHLAAAMGVPWLPQTFLCPVRALGNDPDDARRALEQGLPIVHALLGADARIAVHHMHDPNQDRLMLQHMAYYRLKYRRLPLAYREFLLRSLAPGATLYVSACNRQWPVTRTSSRSVFQFGATGGASESEYFEGSPRVRQYLSRYGIARPRWDPPPADDMAPEAEWGFDPALLDDLQELAEARQWRLIRIDHAEPESLSALTADTYADWYAEQGEPSRRLLVDSFLLSDPLTTLRLRAIPYWSLFGVEPSARLLEQYLQGHPGFDEIDMLLFSHGTEGVGLAPIERWQQLLGWARVEGRLVGVDPSRYPRDFATFTRFAEDLARLGPRWDLPEPMSIAFFEEALQRHGANAEVSLSRLHGASG
ncbi:hypothetical protein ABI260_16115 [Pseudomonas guguanensis]|uniref:hypothetical protein n=1 Tax=Ectopseudomonas guguanensis TaxID=1198456 RepID=UPI003266F3DB